jgi:hypothetical protein
MNWPTTITAPGLGIVTAVAVAGLMWSRHQPVPATAVSAIAAGLGVAAFFHVFGRKA